MATRSRRSLLPRNAGLWLLGLVMIGLVAVVVFTWNEFRAAATRQLLERDGAVTALSAARLEQSLADYAATLDLVARSREMSEGDAAAQTQALDAAAARLAIFDGGVVLFDGHGLVRAIRPERPEIVARNLSARDFFQAVLGGAEMAVSDAQQLFPGDPYVVMIAVPVYGEANAFKGALAGIFDLGEPTLSSFYANIVRLRLGQSGGTYVVDGKGRILFDSESQRVGRFVGAEQLSTLAERAISNAALTQDEDGHKVISASALVPGTSWTLIVQDDWSVVTRETARYRNVLIVCFLAVLLLPPLGLTLLNRQRRFRLPEARRPEHDPRWVTAMRDQTRTGHIPVLPGWDIFARQIPGRSDATDFFDVGLLPDGRLSICLGKLRNAGIAAGVALAAVRAILGSAGQRLLGAEESLRECNALLAARHPASLTVACLYLLIDPSTGVADFAAAGVSPPLQRRGRAVQDAAPGGRPLGSAAAAEVESGELRLEPGGLLVLLGPSMLEARDADGHGFAGAILDAALSHPHTTLPEMVDRLMEAFGAFQQKSPFLAPDRTAIVLERVAKE